MALKTPLDPLIVIVGATGTGKSKLAVELAQRFNGEIVNGDAMQMYKGLPIITNKLRKDEMKGIRHHLLGCVDLGVEPWRVSTFVEESRKIIEDIHRRERLPILVGGTHYYTQSLIFPESLVENKDGQELAYQEKPLDPEQSFILDASGEEMLAKLREVDPEMAGRWHPNDARKIRRSLEIWLRSGRKASDIYKNQKSLNAGDKFDVNAPNSTNVRYSTLVFWLYAENEALKMRLDSRVDDMVRAGLLEEAREMYEYLQSKEAKQEVVDKTRGIWVSIGFKELEQYLRISPLGAITAKEKQKGFEEAIEAVKAGTRQYARRQDRWIRLKLLRAINEARLSDAFFLLDGTDLRKWSVNVEQPAESIVEAFLCGKQTPDPHGVSDAAHEVLSRNEQRTSPLDNIKRNQCRSCDACDMILVGEEQWQQHLVSRKHKNTIRARRKHSETSSVSGSRSSLTACKV